MTPRRRCMSVRLAATSAVCVTKSTTHDVNSIPWKYKNRQLWRTVQLLAVAMLVVGTAVAVAAAKRGQVPELPPPLEFLAVPLGNLTIFAVLVAVGLYNRRKRDSHKRLMMLATIVTAGAALDRLLLPTGVLAFSSLPLNTLTSMSLTAVFLSACFSTT